MFDPNIIDTLINCLYCAPVLISIGLSSFFCIMFRYFAESRPNTNNFLTNILLYQFSYIYQTSNHICGVLVIIDIFNLSVLPFVSCLLHHARIVFTILGSGYAAVITITGTLSQLKPSYTATVETSWIKVFIFI